MKWQKKTALLFLFLLVLLAFNEFRSKSFKTQQIQGLWQSLNDKSSVVEFKENGDFNLYLNKESFYNTVEGITQLRYRITKIHNSEHLEMATYNGKSNELFMRVELRVVDKNRIRLLYLKHNGILDQADEYYKTDGFDNFAAIMSTFDLSNW